MPRSYGQSDAGSPRSSSLRKLPTIIALGMLGIGGALMVHGITGAPSLDERFGETAVVGDQSAAVGVLWPSDRTTGKLMELAKHVEDVEEHPELYPMANLPGSRSPDGAVIPNGVRRVSEREAADLAYRRGWCLLDLRKWADVRDKGTIPGAVFHEYGYLAKEIDHELRLTRQIVEQLLAEHPGLVLFCNGPSCSRSYNAAVTLPQEWGVDPDRLAWFRGGVPSWTATPLLSIDLESRQASAEESE